MKPIDVICALNDVDDEYILHAMSPNRRKVVSIRRVLIAAVIVVVAIVSAAAVYSTKTYRYDKLHQTPTADPVESVINLLENAFNEEDYYLKQEIYGAMVDEEKTAKVLSEETELVKERGWNEDNFVVVYVEYYRLYDHTKTFVDDGYTSAWLYMEYDSANDCWVWYYTKGNHSYEGPEYLGIFEEAGVGHVSCRKEEDSYKDY